MLNSVKGPSLFVGDFNLPGIDWDFMYSDSEGEKQFLDVWCGVAPSPK